MKKTRKQIKIRNRIRELSEQKSTLLNNLNFVSEETSELYFEKLCQFDRDIAEAYRRLKSS